MTRQTVLTTTAGLTAILLLLHSAPLATSQSEPWQRFASNVNYRLTALLDVNGGGFENVPDNNNNDGDATTTTTTTTPTATPGYTIPIDILTTLDPTTQTYRQRISYFGGVQVDYNVDGEGFKAISMPFDGRPSSHGDGDANTDSDDDDSDSDNLCLMLGGSKTDAAKKMGFLNFFPTVEQMKQYTVGELIATEPGIPYRVLTLEATHGSFNATTPTQHASYSMDTNNGMPPNDYYQFHYQESPTSTATAHPVKWTMLARNPIFHAHTENWVLRYVSYDPIDSDEERKLWESWFDLQTKNSGCSDKKENDGFGKFGKNSNHDHHYLQMNRLGMFFSSSSSSSLAVKNNDSGSTVALENETPATTTSTSKVSPFEVFLTQHNKHYPHPQEYTQRKSIHDANLKNIQEWNKHHDGRATFVANEFLDLEVKEVMKFRGGRIPRSSSGGNASGGTGKNEELTPFNKRHLRQSSSVVVVDSEEEEDDGSGFTAYQVPSDFDPSTLPESFDWRTHLPGAVGPIKDQGVCGSCWAFSFISALESHWFIQHSQSVNLPEQFIMDCGWSNHTFACDGGESGFAAKQFIEVFQGKVPTRDIYGGYLSVDGRCYVDILESIGMMNNELSSEPTSSSTSTVEFTDWVSIPPRDDIATKHALFTQGPLAIAFNVVDESLYYANGVLDVPSCELNDESHLDHAINLVGWGVDELADGTRAEHWIIRNSWSTRWGDEGYIKVRMGKRDCGVTTSAGFPVVTKPSHLTSNGPFKVDQEVASIL